MMLDENLKKLGPVIAASEFIRIVLDDSPTKRYGHLPCRRSVLPRRCVVFQEYGPLPLVAGVVEQK